MWGFERKRRETQSPPPLPGPSPRASAALYGWLVDIAPAAATSLIAMAEPKNFGVIEGGEPTRLRREVDRLIFDIRASEIGPRLWSRFLGVMRMRPVVIWLPNTRSPEYRARLADQTRRLAELAADEDTMAAAFEQEAAKTPGWR